MSSDQVKVEVKEEMKAALEKEDILAFPARNLMLTDVPKPYTDDMAVSKTVIKYRKKC